MPFQTKTVFFEDYVFRVWDNVYEPAEDSFLFAENLAVKRGDSVLDVGTGCGILGIVAAAKAAHVVAVDISPYAVRCARENAKLNQVMDKMSFIQGDLFTPLEAEEGFDLVIFNAPYLPVVCKEDDSWIGRAWSGGASGKKVIDCFIRESPKHLSNNGRVFLMQSSLCGGARTLGGFEKRGLNASIVAERDLPFFETIMLVKATRRIKD